MPSQSKNGSMYRQCWNCKFLHFKEKQEFLIIIYQQKNRPKRTKYYNVHNYFQSYSCIIRRQLPNIEERVISSLNMASSAITKITNKCLVHHGYFHLSPSRWSGGASVSRAFSISSLSSSKAEYRSESSSLRYTWRFTAFFLYRR